MSSRAYTMLGMRTIVLLLVIAALAGPSAAYDRGEILKILMAGIRSRDPQVQRSVLLLRQKRLLKGWSRDLEGLARIAEDSEIMAALVLLRKEGVLPDVKITPRALSEYIGRVAGLDDDDMFQALDEPILRYGEFVRDAPFFVRLPSTKVYILGGLALKGTRVEMAYQRPDGFVNVILPNISRAFVRRRHVVEVEGPRRAATQDPDEVQIGLKGPFAYYQAHHGGAILSVIKVKLDEGFGHTIQPHVTRRFDLRRRADEEAQFVHDMAHRVGALGAINGTFFVMQPGTPDHAKPLAPIIIDGKVAWSYREKRVLDMGRCYLAITDRNRAFIGETSLTAEQILEAQRLGRFARRRLRGERLKHLIGGFGWLVRRGDPEGFLSGVGRQFGLSYYSLMVRRPQSVLAVSADGRTVWFVAQEGMPHSSTPKPLPELAAYVAENFKCRDAVFLDGGGSTQMVIQGQNVTRTESNGPYRKNSTIIAVKGPVFVPRRTPFPRVDGR